MLPKNSVLPTALGLVLSALAPAHADAMQSGEGEDRSEAAAEEERDWSGDAEFSLVNAFGNAVSSSFGFRAEAERRLGPRWDLGVEGGYIRASSGQVERSAVGSEASFEVLRTVETRLSADRTNLKARLTGSRGTDAPRRGELFATAGWERDAPAGVRARYDFAAGLGGAWERASADSADPSRLALGAGVAVIRQDDAVSDPAALSTTVGLRLDLDANAFLGRAELALDGVGTWNFRNRDDYRFDATGAVSFPLTGRLAFKSSVQTLFDARPSLQQVPLVEAAGGPEIGAVAVSRSRLDVIFLTSFALAL